MVTTPRTAAALAKFRITNCVSLTNLRRTHHTRTHSSHIRSIYLFRVFPDLHAQALVDAAASMPDWHLGIADHHNLPSSSKVEPDIISKGIFTQLQAYACFRECVRNPSLP